MDQFSILVFFNPHPRICLVILEKDGGKGEGRGRERKRETLFGCFLYAPRPGTEPTTLVYAQTRN